MPTFKMIGALFGIVQGGIDRELRNALPRDCCRSSFPVMPWGGWSVGEEPQQMYDTLDFTVPMLPADKPRYLMGVGRPIDLLEAVLRGVDLFDCVLPTRNGRNGMAFTHSGAVRLKNSVHRQDDGPLDADCQCPVCTRFSRSYLRHLFLVNEMLGPILVSWHNVAYYQKLMSDLRQAIRENRALEFRASQLARWGLTAHDTRRGGSGLKAVSAGGFAANAKSPGL